MAHTDPADKLAYMIKYRADNDTVIKAKQAAHRAGLKAQALQRYGQVCAHCGFDNPLALCIDHVNDNGAEERRAAGGVRTFAGWNFYAYLRKNDWPEGYQTLCANCNMIKQQLRLRTPV